MTKREQAFHEDLGNRIRIMRKKKGMTQAKLAEGANISITHVSHIENARKKPSIDVLMAIINSLGVTPNEMLCGGADSSKAMLISETESLFEEWDRKEMSKLHALLVDAGLI